MKQQSGSKRLSTFARYVVSYMLVLLLALSALFLYMYVYMNREVRAQVISNGINRLSRIAYQHEGYLDNMLNTAEQIGLSPYLQPFSYRDEPWRAYELMQQLVPYTVSNDFSDQMYLCFASDDYLYSSSSMMTLDMFSSLMHYEHVSGTELMRLIRQPGGLCVLPAQKVASSLLGSDQYDMTTFIIPLGMSQKSERGSMLFLLRQNTYQQLFSDAIAMNANTCILHDGAILASSGELPLSAEELTSLLAGNEATMQREFVSGGVPYTLLALGNRSWGMQYVMLMPSSELTGNVWHSMGGVLMMIAALAVAGSVLSYLLARRNIRPIREISSLLPQDESRGDEWSSIQTGIQELSRRNSDLTRRLESSLPMQRHDFVLRFMKGRFDSRELAVAAATSVRLDIDKPYYGMVLCPEQEQNDQPFTMQEEPLNRVTGVTVCSVEMAAMNNFLYVVFADTEQGLHDVANALHQICIERYGHACVAMSNAHQNFTHAPACYLEAATAYDNRFVMDDSRVLEYSFVSVNLRDILPQARKITDGINQALVLNNRALLSGKLDELLAFLKHSSMTPFAFRLIYNDVIHTLLRERRRQQRHEGHVRHLLPLRLPERRRFGRAAPPIVRRDSASREARADRGNRRHRGSGGVHPRALRRPGAVHQRHCRGVRRIDRTAFAVLQGAQPRLPERIPGDSSRRALKAAADRNRTVHQRNCRERRLLRCVELHSPLQADYRRHAVAVPPQQGGHKPWKRRLTCAA